MLKRFWVVALLSLVAGVPAWAQQNPSFNLVNRSGSTINEVYATSAGDDELGAGPARQQLDSRRPDLPDPPAGGRQLRL